MPTDDPMPNKGPDAINFSKLSRSERLDAAKQRLEDSWIAISRDKANNKVSINSLKTDLDAAKNQQKRSFLGIDKLAKDKDKYEILVGGQVMGIFDVKESSEADMVQFLHDMLHEYTDLKSDEAMDKVNEIVQTKWDLADLVDDIQHVRFNPQTAEEIAKQTKRQEKENAITKNINAEEADLLIAKVKNMEETYKNLKVKTMRAAITTKIQKLEVHLGELAYLQRAIDTRAFPLQDPNTPNIIDSVEEAEDKVAALQVVMVDIAGEVRQLYFTHNVVIPAQLDAFLQTLGSPGGAPAWAPQASVTPWATPPTQPWQWSGSVPWGPNAGGYMPNAPQSWVNTMNTAPAAPYDVMLLNRVGGESGESYFLRMGYNQSHLQYIKGEWSPKKYEKKMEKAANYLEEFHAKVAEVQAIYLSDPSLTLAPSALARKVPKEYKGIQKAYKKVLKLNEKIWDELKIKINKKEDGIQPFVVDGSLWMREKWDQIMTGYALPAYTWNQLHGNMHSAAQNNWMNHNAWGNWWSNSMNWMWSAWINRAYSSAGITKSMSQWLSSPHNAQQRYEWLVGRDSVTRVTHFNKMSMAELIAIEAVATEDFDKKIMRRTMLKRLMGVASTGTVKDLRHRTVANPLTENLTLLGNGDFVAGRERFWELFKESYLDNGPMASKVNSKYAQLLRYTNAMHSQNMMNQNVDLVANQMWFMNPADPNALLTNAFIQVVADETWAPGLGVKHIFSMYENNWVIDPAMTADSIRNVMDIDEKEATAWRLFKDNGLADLVRHWMLDQVTKGNIEMKTALAVGNATDVVVKVAKFVTWVKVIQKWVLTAWNWVKWLFNRTFRNSKWDHTANWKKMRDQWKWLLWWAGWYAAASVASTWVKDAWNDAVPDIIEKPLEKAYSWLDWDTRERLESEQALESGVNSMEFTYEHMVAKATGSMTMVDLVSAWIIVDVGNWRLSIDKDALLKLPAAAQLRSIAWTPGWDIKLRNILNKISATLTQQYGTDWQTNIQDPHFGNLALQQVLQNTNGVNSSVPAVNPNVPVVTTSPTIPVVTPVVPGTPSAPWTVPGTPNAPVNNVGVLNPIIDSDLRSAGLRALTATQLSQMSAADQQSYYERAWFALQQVKKMNPFASEFTTYFSGLWALDYPGPNWSNISLPMRNVKTMFNDALDRRDWSNMKARDAITLALNNMLQANDPNAVQKYFDLIWQVFGWDQSYDLKRPWTNTVIKLYEPRMGSNSLAAYLHDATVGNVGTSWTYVQNPTLWSNVLARPLSVWGNQFNSQTSDWKDIL